MGLVAFFGPLLSFTSHSAFCTPVRRSRSACPACPPGLFGRFPPLPFLCLPVPGSPFPVPAVSLPSRSRLSPLAGWSSLPPFVPTSLRPSVPFSLNMVVPPLSSPSPDLPEASRQFRWYMLKYITAGGQNRPKAVWGYQKPIKTDQKRSKPIKNPLPILTFCRKTALALAPRGFWGPRGYQKWEISPNLYTIVKPGFGIRDSGFGKGQTARRWDPVPCSRLPAPGSPFPPFLLSAVFHRRPHGRVDNLLNACVSGDTIGAPQRKREWRNWQTRKA
jgi:hypothetical protein